MLHFNDLYIHANVALSLCEENSMYIKNRVNLLSLNFLSRMLFYIKSKATIIFYTIVNYIYQVLTLSYSLLWPFILLQMRIRE